MEAMVAETLVAEWGWPIWWCPYDSSEFDDVEEADPVEDGPDALEFRLELPDVVEFPLPPQDDNDEEDVNWDIDTGWWGCPKWCWFEGEWCPTPKGCPLDIELGWAEAAAAAASPAVVAPYLAYPAAAASPDAWSPDDMEHEGEKSG